MSEQYTPVYAKWYPWDEVLEWRTLERTLEWWIHFKTTFHWLDGNRRYRDAIKAMMKDDLAYSIYWRENGVVCTILVRKEKVLHDHEA